MSLALNPTSISPGVLQTVLWSSPGWISRDLWRHCSIFPPLKKADFFFSIKFTFLPRELKGIFALMWVWVPTFSNPQIQQDNGVIHLKTDFHPWGCREIQSTVSSLALGEGQLQTLLVFFSVFLSPTWATSCTLQLSNFCPNAGSFLPLFTLPDLVFSSFNSFGEGTPSNTLSSYHSLQNQGR